MGPDDRPSGLPVKIDAPRPMGSLADLSDLLGGDSNRSRQFLGGIVVGALVGAAIAGTSLLRRRRPGSDR